MNFSKKVNYTLWAFLVLLNIIIRYPTTSHEMGVDSFVIHSLANSISVNGYAKWIIHPLSVFGLYPYSYSSGVPYLLSGISQCAGLSMELTVFILAIFVGLLGMFCAYLMAKEIKKDDLFTLLVVFAFSTAPMFLNLTRWTTSTRHLFIALLPLFIWSILRYPKTKDKRYALLSFVLLITMATIHRMFVLVIPILGACLGSTIIQGISGKIKFSKEFLISVLAILLLTILVVCALIITNNLLPLILLIFIAYFLNSLLKKLDKKLRVPTIVSFMLGLLFICAFFIQFSEIEFYKGLWYDYHTGYFGEGTAIHILVLNMCTNYAGQIGTLIIFGLLGLIFILCRPKKDIREWFVALSILFLCPLLALGTYVAVFLLPFFAILIGIGLSDIIKIKKIKRYVIPVVIGCLLISLSFAGFMMNHWDNLPLGDTNNIPTIDDETTSAAIFIKKYTFKPFTSIDSIIGHRISAYSEVPYFPGSYASPIAYDLVKEEINVEQVPVSKILVNLGMLYTANNTVQNDFSLLLTLDSESTVAKDILSKYAIAFFVETKNVQWRSTFFKSICERKYKIYDDGVESIWYIGVGR